MMSDPISDMIIRLQNAAMAGRSVVTLPFSQLKWNIAKLLQDLGYVTAVNKKGKKVKKYLEMELKYDDKKPALAHVRRVSKPSRRIYHPVSKIRSVRQGFGHAIYSTPRGILTDHQARAAKVGGEILFQIW